MILGPKCTNTLTSTQAYLLMALLSRLVGASVGSVYAFKWASLRMSNALLMRALI